MAQTIAEYVAEMAASSGRLGSLHVELDAAARQADSEVRIAGETVESDRCTVAHFLAALHKAQVVLRLPSLCATVSTAGELELRRDIGARTRSQGAEAVVNLGTLYGVPVTVTTDPLAPALRLGAR